MGEHGTTQLKLDAGASWDNLFGGVLGCSASVAVPEGRQQQKLAVEQGRHQLGYGTSAKSNGQAFWHCAET